MKKFKMYNEWRGVELYGQDLADAIIRRKKFQRPDVVHGCKAGIVTRTDGEWVEVEKIIGYEDTSQKTRGSCKYITVVAELVDKNIVSFDAKEINVTIK